MVEHKDIEPTIKEARNMEVMIRNTISVNTLSDQEVNQQIKTSIEELRDARKKYEMQSVHRKQIFERSENDKYGLSIDKKSMTKIDGVSRRKGSYYYILQNLRQIKIQNAKDI